MSARSPGKNLGQMRKRAARGLTAQGPAGGPGPMSPLSLCESRQIIAGAESHSDGLGRALPHGARLGVLGAPFGGMPRAGKGRPARGLGCAGRGRLWLELFPAPWHGDGVH